jgi:hypothetical protein
MLKLAFPDSKYTFVVNKGTTFDSILVLYNYTWNAKSKIVVQHTLWGRAQIMLAYA